MARDCKWPGSRVLLAVAIVALAFLALLLSPGTGVLARDNTKTADNTAPDSVYYQMNARHANSSVFGSVSEKFTGLYAETCRRAEECFKVYSDDSDIACHVGEAWIGWDHAECGTDSSTGMPMGKPICCPMDAAPNGQCLWRGGTTGGKVVGCNGQCHPGKSLCTYRKQYLIPSYDKVRSRSSTRTLEAASTWKTKHLLIRATPGLAQVRDLGKCSAVLMTIGTRSRRNVPGETAEPSVLLTHPLKSPLEPT